MCGIAGFINMSARQGEPVELEKALDSIAHRGPDDQGIFRTEKVGLGHRRLSVIDLSPSGHQPMATVDGSHVIVFNGEIYNYKELRNELKQSGVCFRGASDTEVLLNAMKTWGESALARLNGIFSFAIFDSQDMTLTLARDRFGVKPLYYRSSEGVLYFGSEIKAILHMCKEQFYICPQAFHEFLYYGNTLGCSTMFEGIKKLEAGQFLRISKAGIEKKHFWSISKDVRPYEGEIIEHEVFAETRWHLENAVKRQLVSDVPVGLFLSGGIDSSAIATFASRNYNRNLITYSAGFDFDNGHNELEVAARTAKVLNTEHREIFIRGGDLWETIKSLVKHHDEPFSDAANIPLYLMSREIRHECKVILQGDGGDELFGGYSRYPILSRSDALSWILPIMKMFNNPLLPQVHRAKIDRFHGVFSERDYGRRFGKLLTLEVEGRESPEGYLTDSVRRYLQNSNPFRRYEYFADAFAATESVVQKMLWTDMAVILPDQFLEKVDKSTMANGVEVRVPFLDNDLASFAMSLPAWLKVKRGCPKYVLKKSLKGIVSDEVLNGGKKGFGVPYQNWIKGPLKEPMLDVLSDSRIRDLEIFQPNAIKRAIDLHLSGGADKGFLLWKLMNFCIWRIEYGSYLSGFSHKSELEFA